MENDPLTNKIYIPPRLYSRLEKIYTDRATLVAAPAGYGKSTMIKEFISRSRRDGLSCRFIRSASSVNDCFAQVCRIIMGCETFPPETDLEFMQLRQKTPITSDSNTLIVIDCPFAIESLIENLRVTELFTRENCARLIILSDKFSETHLSAARALDISIVTENDLRFTLSEAEEYFRYCSVECSDIAGIFSLCGGQIMRLRLCLKLISLGITPESGSITELTDKYARAAMQHGEFGAFICAASAGELDDDYIRSLKNSPRITEYFGRKMFEHTTFLSSVRTFSDMSGLCRLNIKTRRFVLHPLIKGFAARAAAALPQDVRSELKLCSAKQLIKQQKFYYAFCELFLAGDYNAAAECSNSTPVSLRDIADTKDVLTEFVEKCPFDNKELVPRYLRVLAILMLTSEKEALRGNFKRAIEHITSSPDYDAKERRRMLSYAYALRTYEDFFFIERMGNHIKRAYEYFDGTGSLSSPFYTWNMYAPSLFGLIHNYSLSLKTEREQFSRYHSMYREILNHGEFILEYYNAEAAYFTGELSIASGITSKLLKRCIGKANDAPRLIGLLLLGKTAICTGNYMTYIDMENSITDILHKTQEREVYIMARMSLAMLDMTCGNIKYSAFFACCKDDEEIRLNRFAAPYYCLISAMYRLALGMTDRILADKEYYFSITDEVRNGTVRHQLYLILAESLFLRGEPEAAADYAGKALTVIEGTSIYMPAAEVLIYCPRTREHYRRSTPESAVVLRACDAAEGFILGSETIKTYKLTTFRMPQRKAPPPEPAFTEEIAMKHGLSAKEYAVSALAAKHISNEEIAQELSTSVDSVKSCLKRVFAKTGIRSRNGLEALFAIGVLPNKDENQR